MAPVLLQLVVSGSVIVMRSPPDGRTLISQLWLLPWVCRLAWLMFPPLIEKASSRMRS